MARKQDYEALESIAAHALMEFNPAIEDCDRDFMSYGRTFTIETPKAAPVVFNIDRDTCENKRGDAATISIFARFENAKAARALGFDCNMFSGKWNHHFLWSRSHITAIFHELKCRAF